MKKNKTYQAWIKPGRLGLGVGSLLLALLTLGACSPFEENLNLPPAQAQSPVVPSDFKAQAVQPNDPNFSQDAATPTAAIAPTPTLAPGATPAPAPSPTVALPTPTVDTTNVTPIDFKGKGTVWDRTFFSKTLNRSMPYRIYFPAGYQTSNRRYPVLYMLHGFSGDYKEWVDYGLLGRADDLMGGNSIQPFLIVLPLGEQGYWFNNFNGPRWGDYIVNDVVGHIDATYRTVANQSNRAIGGHSMGGHGALQIGFNYPGVFGAVGAHSATLRTLEQATGDFWGDASYYPSIDPLSLAQTKKLGGFKLWLDIGKDDVDWRPRVEELHKVLLDKGVPHTWTVWPGKHGGEYWAGHVTDYLIFYSNSFPRTPSAASK